MRPRRHRTRRSKLIVGGLLASALIALALSMGCSLNTVAVDEAHVAPGSPRGISKDAPLIVLRDNPIFTGLIFIGVNETVVTNDLIKYGVANVIRYTGTETQSHTGKLQFHARGWDFATNDMRILSMLPSAGPETTGVPYLAKWRTAGFELLPTNIYSVDLYHAGGCTNPTHLDYCTGRKVKSPDPLWLKLSPEVLIVPVIVVTLDATDFNNRAEISEDYSKFGKMMFDYVPYNTFDFWDIVSSVDRLPLCHKYQYQSTECVEPVGQYHLSSQASWDFTPPDEIWAQCKVQFQAVAAATVKVTTSDIPMANCSGFAQQPVFLTANQLREKVRGKVRDDILDELRPKFVVFANLQCVGFYGIAQIPGDQVEIDVLNESAPHATVAHELGHSLNLQHIQPGGDQSRLMHPSLSGSYITPDECSRARAAAMDYHDRFRAYNIKRGKASAPIYTMDGVSNNIGGGVIPPLVCCATEKNVYWMEYANICTGYGNTIVAKENCSKCCLNSNGTVSMVEECTGTLRPKSDCTKVCCGSTDSFEETDRYHCQQGGKPIIQCPPEQPH